MFYHFNTKIPLEQEIAGFLADGVSKTMQAQGWRLFFSSAQVTVGSKG